MARSGGFSKMKWYYQIAVVAGICGALLAGVWYQFLSPMQDQINSKQSQLTTLNAEVAKALQQKLYFEKMKAESQQLEATLLDLKGSCRSRRKRPRSFVPSTPKPRVPESAFCD
jgi:hypothetical protein